MSKFQEYYLQERYWEDIEQKLISMFPNYSNVIKWVFRIPAVQNWIDKRGSAKLWKELNKELDDEERKQAEQYKDKLIAKAPDAIKAVTSKTPSFDYIMNVPVGTTVSQWESVELDEGLMKPKVLLYAIMLFLSTLMSSIEGDSKHTEPTQTQFHQIAAKGQSIPTA